MNSISKPGGSSVIPRFQGEAMKNDTPNPRLIWLCIIAYRWIALLHIMIMLLLGATRTVPLRTGWLLFVLAVIYTGIVTIFRNTAFNNRSYWPAFLAIDLLVIGLLQAFGGGWRSAWYLFSFSTVLTATFFYHMKGALIVAAIASLIYFLSVLANGRELLRHLMINNLDDMISNLFSYFLIAAFFAYPCVLFDRLSKAKMELAYAHQSLESSRRQLELLYKATPLTKREIEVLNLLAESKSNKEIAAELHISEETVKSHVKNIFRKLNFKSRTEAASYFWKLD